jgi:hypothetical protein
MLMGGCPVYLEVVDTPNVAGHPPINSLFGSTGKKLSGVSFIMYGDKILPFVYCLNQDILIL